MTRTTLILPAALGLLITPGAPVAQAGGCPVTLTLEEIPPPPSRRPSTTPRPPEYRAVLHNGGAAPVTLVRPGDGSESGMRTPSIDWRLSGPEGRVDTHLQRMCGNINALKAEELIELGPGEQVSVEVDAPVDLAVAPGEYQLSLSWDHNPKMTWSGIPLGHHSSEAMERIRASQRCKMTSNPVSFVIPAPAAEEAAPEE